MENMIATEVVLNDLLNNFSSHQLPGEVLLCNRLQELMEKNFRTNRDLRVYYKALNVTPYYLNVVTRNYTGKSVYELLQDRVHREALYLLRFTCMSIKQISFELGCCDSAYFCRCFRARMGETAKAYRKRYSGVGDILPSLGAVLKRYGV